jgi:hypothetical protein
VWGAGLVVLFSLARRLPVWLGSGPLEPVTHFNIPALLGPRHAVSGILDLTAGDMLLGLGTLLLYLILRFVLRREWLAIVGLVALLTAIQLAGTHDPLWLSIPLRLAIMGSYAFVLLRFGLLAAIAGPFVADALLVAPLTTDLGAWYSGPTILAVLLVCTLAVLAFRTAQGGSGLRRYLAGEGGSRP